MIYKDPQRATDWEKLQTTTTTQSCSHIYICAIVGSRWPLDNDIPIIVSWVRYSSTILPHSKVQFLVLLILSQGSSWRETWEKLSPKTDPLPSFSSSGRSFKCVGLQLLSTILQSQLQVDKEEVVMDFEIVLFLIQYCNNIFTNFFKTF